MKMDILNGTRKVYKMQEKRAIEHIKELIIDGVFDEIRALIGVDKK